MTESCLIKHKIKKNVHPSPRKPAAGKRTTLTLPKILPWSSIPATGSCPTVYCDDELPEQPNTRILNLFQQRHDLIQQVARKGAGVGFLDPQIYSAIKQEQNRGRLSALGLQNKWPDKINYTAVPARILKMEKPLVRVIQNASVLVESTIWQTFLRAIDHKLFRFAESASKKEFTYALYARRCG
jgi:hypothetical protein